MAKSHVIPKSFFHLSRGEEKHLLETIASEKDGVISERPLQAGIYDQTIICRGCEPRFSAWDDHGYRVLTKTLEQKVRYNAPWEPPCALFFQNLDYAKFRLFALSVLWRASITSMRFYDHVHLGPHEKRILRLLKAGNPGTWNYYPISCFFHIGHPAPQMIPAPIRLRHKSGRVVYKIYLPHCAIVFIVTKDRIDVDPSVFVRPDAVNLMPFWPYHDSVEERHINGFIRSLRIGS